MNFKNKALNLISNAVIVIDTDFKILYTNSILQGWLKKNECHFENNQLHEVFPGIKTKKYAKRLEKLFKFQAPVILSSLIHKNFIDILLTNNEYMIQETAIYPIKEDGEEYAIICIQDVTNHNKTLQVVKGSSDKIKKIANAKLHFLSLISHDLRTPLNGIVGSIELLRSTNLQEEQSESIDDIEACGKYLYKLINNFLDISKLETSNLNLNKESIKVNNIINEVEKLFRVSMDTKGIKYTVQTEIDKNLWALVDEVRIKQIIMNLHNNACKFTSSGEVTFKTSLIDEKLIFSVKDTGKGISKMQQEFIFEKFGQVDITKEVSYQGFGLGLSIVKSLVEKMQGHIQVISDVDKGAEFIVELPFIQGKDCTISTKSKTKANSACSHDFSHIKALVAEDNIINQKIIKKFLLKLGIECTLVEDGKMAVEEASKNHYQVILLDYLMPNLNGVQALKEIMKAPSSHTPITISVSANALTEDKIMFEEAGFDYILSKPFGLHDLLKIMESAFIKSKAS